MKRTVRAITVFAAAFALVLSLAACSSSTNASGSIAASTSATQAANAEAEEFNGSEYYEVAKENAAKAKSEYDGKTYKVTGTVESIYSDNITLCTDTFSGRAINPFTVKLPTEQIAELSTGDTITAVGKFVYKESPNLCIFEDATLAE